MIRIAFVALLATATISERTTRIVPADVNQAVNEDGLSDLPSCKMSQVRKMQYNAALVATCAENKGCGEGQQRRRLADQNDQDYFSTFNCYCRNCQTKLANLQTACNACDAINYVDPCGQEGGNDNGKCQNNDYGEFLYEETCVVNQFLLASHADDFCAMMKGSKTCLKEMQYIMNPPEQEDDNNNNNRRRLKDDNNREEQQIDPQQLVECWTSPLMGGESYSSLTSCHNACALYGNTTYEYLYNGKEDPVQFCGMSISAYDEKSDTIELLPSTLRHQGVACVSSSCTADDADNIMNYVSTLAAYSSVIMMGGEDQDRNNNQDDQNMFWQTTKSIPLIKASWKCSGDAADGAIADDGFPDDDEECQEKKEEKEQERDTMEARWATATTFAIIFALGMGVFACLYLHYYRKYSTMKQSQSGNASLIENQQGQPSYGGTAPTDQVDI